MAGRIYGAEPAAALGLSEQENAWLAKHPVIRVAVDPDRAPIEFIDQQGRFQGISSEYLLWLEQRLDVRFEVARDLNWQQAGEAVRRSELSMSAAIRRTPQRESYLAFTEPYLSLPVMIFARLEVPYISHLSELRGQRVAVLAGHALAEMLAGDEPNIELLTTSSTGEALQRLASGEAHAFVGDILTTSYHLGKLGLTGIKVVGETPYRDELAMAAPKNQSVLAAILQKAIATMPQTERNAIQQRWVAVKYEQGFDYGLLWQFLIPALLAVVILSYWLQRLSNEIESRRIAEEKMRKAVDAAETANQAKNLFLANMSHELRTPLNAILGYAQILNNGRPTEQVRQEGLNTIERSGRHLLELIDDLLDLARIESQKLALELSAVRLPQLLEDAAAIARIQAQQKNLEFVATVDGTLPAIIEADGKRLREILLNLLNNAIKFTDRGRVGLNTQVSAGENGQINLSLNVEDTGSGIAQQHLERIFKPFEQLEALSSRRIGSGLGLAISHRLAQMMGGDITVESHLGEGSIFCFSAMFPVLQQQLEKEAQADTIVDYKGERRKILVVDDQAENRQLLLHWLKPLGFDIKLAEDGVQAVSEANSWRPDLILMDLRLPGMDGLTATREIHALPELATVPVIAISASIENLEQIAAGTPGFAAYLRKPLQSRELFSVLKVQLGLSWSYAEVDSASEATSTAEEALIAPPRDLLEQLYQLARTGKLVRIEQMALELAQSDSRYRPFARHLSRLAHDFEEEQITLLLRAHLQL